MPSERRYRVPPRRFEVTDFRPRSGGAPAPPRGFAAVTHPIDRCDPVPHRDQPRGAGQNISRAESEPKAGTQAPRGSRRVQFHRRALRAIQFSPLNHPRGGPGQEWGFATLDAGPHCPIRPSVGSCSRPITQRPWQPAIGSAFHWVRALRVSIATDSRLS